MNNTKILIVEDDFSFVIELEMMLESLGYNHICKVENGEEALLRILSEPPDLILMDINLNGVLTGIDLAKKIKNLKIPIIYLTAFLNPEYFEKAKETCPFAYLNKPFDYIFLQRSIELALAHCSASFSEKEREEKNEVIYIKKSGKLEKVNFVDILWVKSEGNYCLLNTDDRKFAIKTSLIKLKKKFPANKFIQSHRSILVQVDKISSIDLSAKKICISNNFLPIGRTFQKEVLKRVKDNFGK